MTCVLRVGYNPGHARGSMRGEGMWDGNAKEENTMSLDMGKNVCDKALSRDDRNSLYLGYNYGEPYRETGGRYTFESCTIWYLT